MTKTAANLLSDEKNGQPVQPIATKTAIVGYCLCVHKSSEDDERQALSIDAQVKKMGIQAEAQGLRFTEIRKESYSAKYALTESTRDEKRALIPCLERTIYLKNKEVTTET